MKAVLKDEIIMQVFSVTSESGNEFEVTCNLDNHNVDWDLCFHIPEFHVRDKKTGEVLDKRCQDWEDAVEAVKKWGCS